MAKGLTLGNRDIHERRIAKGLRGKNILNEEVAVAHVAALPQPTTTKGTDAVAHVAQQRAQLKVVLREAVQQMQLGSCLCIVLVLVGLLVGVEWSRCRPV